MSAISRREMFRSLFGQRTGCQPVSEGGHPACPDSSGWKPAIQNSQDGCSPPQLALILDRFCLAHQGSFCSVCSERCPEPGAILTEMGKPRVNPDLCTGCRICHDVCPAPKNAVFLVARAPRPGMIGRTVSETQPAPDV
jgi:ferredoxin